MSTENSIILLKVEKRNILALENRELAVWMVQEGVQIS